MYYHVYKAVLSMSGISCLLLLFSLRTDTLIEILSTSTATSEDNEFAKELIVLALNDPSNYFYNNILQLEAVKNLQSQESKVYEVSSLSAELTCMRITQGYCFQLFNIFVEGRLSSFTSFCESNRSFVEELGL